MEKLTRNEVCSMVNRIPQNLLLFAFYICFLAPSSSQAQIVFSEPFDEANGATTGTDNTAGVAWTSNCPTCVAGDYWEIQGGAFEGNDTNGPGTWETGLIDISGCQFVEVSFDITDIGTMEACNTGCNSGDWVAFQYNIDGTGWQDPSNSFFCAGGCAGLNVIQSDDIAGGTLNYNSGCLGGGGLYNSAFKYNVGLVVNTGILIMSQFLVQRLTQQYH